MPRRLPPHVHWDPNDTRDELLAGAAGVTLDVGDVQMRATPVPLLRQAASGGLEQAVRLRLRSPRPRPGVAVAIHAGERVLDRTTVDVPAGAVTDHLFVPEVDRQALFRLSVEIAGEASGEAEIAVTPQRQWSIFLVHHSHFDYGYTDPQAVVMEHQLRYLDAVLDLVAGTDGWPDDAAFRWNVEVTYPLQRWLAQRPRADRDEFVARAKQGRIEVNALPFSMHTEAYSIDELAWGFRFADELRERHGLDIVSAIQSDVPGATIGLLNLLLAADIRYLSVAHNYAGRSVPFQTGGQDLTRPFYWRAANGERLLVWQTDTPHGVAYMDGNLVGLAEGESVARGLLPDYLLALTERPYPYGKHAFGWHDLPPGLPVTKRPYPYDVLHLRVQNTIADNAPPSLRVAETVRDWNARWAYPRLRLSTNREFFEEAETRYGDRLDTFAGDWTDWWMDGIGAGALPLGRNRRAQGLVRTGQTLHALSDSLGGERADEVTGAIGRTYEALALFDEHTWGAANPWQDGLDQMASGALQWSRKASFAYDAFERASALVDSGLHRFATAFQVAADALGTIVVFNPSGWSRTDVVRVFLPAERAALGQSLAVIDVASERVVPHALEPQAHPDFRAAGQWLLFRAGDVPPVGFARFVVVAGEERGDAAIAPEPAGDPWALETDQYRLVCDGRDGFIASIVDRETGRELVDGEAPFGFNEYIYDRYTSAPDFNHLSGRVQALDQSLFGSRATAGQAAIVGRSSDAVRERLTFRSVAEGAAWLETTLTLAHGVKRIDVANRVQKIATRAKESVYFAFPFAVNDADPEYDVTGGVTSQAAPHVPGSVRHVFAVRNWIAMRDDRGAVAWATLEAPLAELATIALPYAPFPTTIPEERTRSSTIYSWAMNNIWDTNFPPSQGGETTFHYAVASDVSTPSRELGLRTAAAISAPLVGLCLPVRPGGGRGKDLPARGSFCSISDPLVEVVSLAPSRRDHDLVAFLHSLAPEPVEARVSFPLLPVRRMSIGTFQERDYQAVASPGGEGTVRLDPGAYVALALDLER